MSVRQQTLLMLDIPRCPREIRERIPGTTKRQIESTISRLAQDRLIRCVTPETRQARLYERTYLGDLLYHELTWKTPPKRGHWTDVELDARSFVQSGQYRRLLLLVMAGGQRSKEIRKAVLPLYDRIGANHVHRVLRVFAARGIARRDDDGLWWLTPLGEKLRSAELDTLPERPAISGPLWERIEPMQKKQHDENSGGEKDPAKG